MATTPQPEFQIHPEDDGPCTAAVRIESGKIPNVMPPRVTPPDHRP